MPSKQRYELFGHQHIVYDFWFLLIDGICWNLGATRQLIREYWQSLGLLLYWLFIARSVLFWCWKIKEDRWRSGFGGLVPHFLSILLSLVDGYTLVES